MDTLPTQADQDDDLEAAPAIDVEPPPAIGTDERRMHVRAYNYWASLLKGRPFPAIADLDPSSIGDFGPHSVILDFTANVENPSIPWLGRALREEAGIEGSISTLSDVPGRSLLSRLTAHWLEIIANRAPIGFEAEFVNRRGLQAMYRGILMPLSSDGTKIDFLYGVINWKEMATPAISAALEAEVAQALAERPAPIAAPVAPIWADGPNRTARAAPGDSLCDQLAVARELAEAASGADLRSRGALYRALGLAYDFALSAEGDPDGYAEILSDAGLKAQARAPMTPIVKLVFGAKYDKTRLTEFATALAHGRREDVGPGELRSFVERHAGGLKGVVAAARARRRMLVEQTLDPVETMRRALRGAASIELADAAPGEEFFLALVRRDADGGVRPVAAIADSALVARAMRCRAAA